MAPPESRDMRRSKVNEDEDFEMVEGMSGMRIKDMIWQAQLENFREIIINGEITDDVVERVVIQIQNINRVDNTYAMQLQEYKRDPITIYISSPGGSVDASFAVVSAIEASVTPVITVAVGKAMSGGFLILLAGHRRYAQKYARLMYHELSSGVGGKATDVREYSEELEWLQDQIKRYVLSRTEIEEEILDECHTRKIDWYMDIEEALDYGCIDGVWPPAVYGLLEEETATGCECESECADCSCEQLA